MSSTYSPAPGSPSPSLPQPTAASSGGRNPLSLRLWKVIGSTNFDDSTSREALQTVSDAYTGGPSGSSVGVNGNGNETATGSHWWSTDATTSAEAGPSKTNKYSYPGGDGIENAIAASKIDGNAAAMARRNFRKDLEWKLSEGSARFLEAFGEVDKKLQVLREHMQDMSTRCDQVQTQLEQANQGTKYLLERADGLRSQKSSTQLRATLSNLLITRFTLTPQEVKQLTSREIEVGPELFAAMDRVTEIRRDCRSLFAFAGAGKDVGGAVGLGEDGVDEGDVALVGNEIMATTVEQLEAGYTKVHRWCQFEFRKFTREHNLEVSGLMKDAIRRLKERPDLLQTALQVLTETRQQYVLQSFLDALTRGGPGGLPRPIELHAHDTTRYVGDMLAWVHQITAGEREFLDSLFGVGDAKRKVGEVRDVTVGGEEDVLGRQCLDKNLEGLCRPLRTRIQHTIKSQEGIIMAYKVTNLLQFYLITMQRTLGSGAVLTETLDELHDHANGAFFATLDSQGRSLLRFLHPPDANLAPPLALRDSAQILHEILSVYDTSLVDEADRVSDFSKILQAAVDPPLEMCQRMADMRQRGTPWEKHIFLINCLLYMEHVLESYPFTSPQRAIIDEGVQQHVAALTQEHRENTLTQSGLAPILAAIAQKSADPLSFVQDAEPKNVSSAMKTFESFLASLDVLNSPSLALLSSPKVAGEIHRGALEGLGIAYLTVYEAVTNKDNKYEFASTLLSRGPDEVGTLLGVDLQSN